MRRPLRENTFRCLWATLRRDARRAGASPLTSGGFWLVVSYRVRRLRHLNGAAWALLLPIDLLLSIGKPWFAPGCQLPWRTRIGPGLGVQHAWGVVVGGDAVLRSRVTLFQGVTVGRWNNGLPTIRSDTALFPGANVSGRITVGRRCMIGANAVVKRDVPSYHVAAGVPAVNRPRTDLAQHASGPAETAHADGPAGERAALEAAADSGVDGRSRAGASIDL